ncbi:MAG: hypothetical protein DME22_17730 [Verrucomicrobia bacterium]|nr:MAG: hypothetical protein DME22_17730 [Verrucomicrobiota bacterium]PYK00515.1 MAG: hypothetical protein DME23_07015 [Verrucomicrobiota bacterium]
MLIFVDESGNFTIPHHGKRNLSCVGALIVPETAHNDLIGAFVKLRDMWAGSLREVKGNTLREEQTAELIDLLVDRGCLLFICATEMSLNSASMIANFQREQSEYITENITDAHHPLLRRQVFRLRQRFESMPAQLFLQSVLLTDVIRKAIDESSVHFAMKNPPELGAFRWFIDGKDKTKTAYEAAWELMAAGLIQSKGIEKPGIAVVEGDYTFFRRSFMDADPKWPDYLPKPQSRGPFQHGMIWNLKKVLYDSLSFVDSKNCCGLQLVDIVTSTFRRALMGRLKQQGYERLGELMRRLGPSPVELHLFNSNGSQRGFSEYDNAVALIDSRSQLVGK